jgi:hypothetical protein
MKIEPNEQMTNTNHEQIDQGAAAKALKPKLSLPLTVTTHLHSAKQRQIMLVIDRDDVRRLGHLVPELGQAVARSKTWPGKRVLVAWSGVSFRAKLTHHRDNGQVKLTVSKKYAMRLHAYLEPLCDRPTSERSFPARYAVGVPGGTDELAVDIPVSSTVH